MAKFAETIKRGYYFNEDRCYYLTGTLKGNKWIYLDWLEEGWASLLWTCIDAEMIEDLNYSKTVPKNFNISLTQ